FPAAKSAPPPSASAPTSPAPMTASGRLGTCSARVTCAPSGRKQKKRLPRHCTARAPVRLRSESRQVCVATQKEPESRTSEPSQPAKRRSVSPGSDEQNEH